MIIYSLSGKTLFETRYKTMRGALEEAVEKGADLSFADLRHLKIVEASLDGLFAPGACFWGADLRGGDLGYGTFRGADMRCVDLTDCCLANSDLTDANLNGAYFSRTILDGVIMDRVRVSCPSFWENELQMARSLSGLVYSHRGEEEMVLERHPVVIRGMGRPIVLHGDTCLWGSIFYKGENMSGDLRETIATVHATIERMTKNMGRLHNARNPMPKKGNPGTLN